MNLCFLTNRLTKWFTCSTCNLQKDSLKIPTTNKQTNNSIIVINIELYEVYISSQRWCNLLVMINCYYTIMLTLTFLKHNYWISINHKNYTHTAKKQCIPDAHYCVQTSKLLFNVCESMSFPLWRRQVWVCYLAVKLLLSPCFNCSLYRLASHSRAKAPDWMTHNTKAAFKHLQSFMTCNSTPAPSNSI